MSPECVPPARIRLRAFRFPHNLRAQDGGLLFAGDQQNAGGSRITKVGVSLWFRLTPPL